MVDTRIIDPSKFIDIKPMKSGALLELALSTIELLEECDLTTISIVEVLENKEATRQDMLDKIMFELEQITLSGCMDAPLEEL